MNTRLRWLSSPFFFAFVLTMLSSGAAAALETRRLQCEHLRNPQGVDAPRPRLSWSTHSDARGDRQTAYEVRVATSREALEAGEADAWRSGKVVSQQSVLVPYSGRPLRSHEHLFWQVRVWDARGEAGPWSETADWLMGVLGDTPWEAQWIGKDEPKRVEHLSDSQWIWFPEGEPNESAPLGARYFRRTFTVPPGRTIQSATFRVAADDHVQINLNGRNLGTRSGPTSTKELNVAPRLHAGENVIALRATNRGEAASPAGLIAWLQVQFDQGDPVLVVSDGDWLCADQEQPGWQSPGRDDSGWGLAKVLGPAGMPPWGPVRHAEPRDLPARRLRIEFEAPKPVVRAVASYAGLGCSELYVNGVKAGDQVLSPGMTEYPARCFYVTRDVTDSIRVGKNALGVILGNGRFYAPRSEVYAGMPTYGSPKLLFRMTLTHPDGSQTLVKSDASWRLTTDGPTRANNEYDGECYDARREMPGWSQPDFDDSGWSAAQVVSAASKAVQAEPVAPIRVTQTIKPISLSQPRPGVWVFDLGQNIVGWCRLRVSGPAGQTVRIRHAEALNSEGGLYVANLRGALNTDYYTLSGADAETWEPRFTSHGFRYVELTGFPGQPTLETIEGRVVHDDLEPVGEFACSNETINSVYTNARWGIRGNYRSIPTDCPQRDERQGWLGDRLETARSESYLFDVAAFYRKWLQDIRDTQLDSGSLPDIAPAHWRRYQDDVVWPSASVLLPGILLDQYGDQSIVEEHYASCRRWVNYMQDFIRPDGLIDRDSYGDWCVPPESPLLIHSEDPARKTDTTLLASSFFYHDLRQMQRYATLLSHSADAERYASAAERIRAAINGRFYDAAEGRYSNGTQTSSVLPLAFGLPAEGAADRVAATLADHVAVRDQGAIATGLVGAQFLCRTLTKIGRPDLAFDIASREAYPSWGYMVAKDATTIWELWNGDTADPAMNSGNHVMLIGDLITWLYEDLAGLAPHADQPGFRRLLLRPQPVSGLDWARASFDSPYGRVRSHWRRENGRLNWSVLVPPGVTAEAWLPTADAGLATEGGRPLAESRGVEVRGLESGRVVLELASGAYEFSMPD